MNKNTGHIFWLLLSVVLMGAVFGGLLQCSGGASSSSSSVSLQDSRPVRRGIPSAPSQPRLVNDFAGVLGSRADELEQVLVAFDDSTSNQITVVTVTSLDGYSVEEFAVELGRKWGVGSSRDNGVVVLVKPKTRDSGGDVTIQVGYGLEGAITDAYCRRIIENQMIPAFKEEDYYKGIYNACDQLMKLASGEISEPRSDDPSGFEILIWFVLPMVLFFVVLVILSKKSGGGGNDSTGSGGSRRPFIWIGPGYGSSSSSGWGGSSHGGGWGGGFGGFGGGSFGGGGASGHW